MPDLYPTKYSAHIILSHNERDENHTFKTAIKNMRTNLKNYVK